VASSTILLHAYAQKRRIGCFLDVCCWTLSLVFNAEKL
jgi:hypothetical protein